MLHKGNDGLDGMSLAVSQSGAMAETLSKFLPVNYELEQRYISNNDPIGSMVVAAKFGMTAAFSDYSLSISKYRKSERCWAGLRNGVPLCFDESEDDVFNALSRSNSVNLWIWASCEPEMQRHPKTGDTVLHLLCRTESLNTEEKMTVLSALKKDFRNPLIPNFRNKRAIDLTNDPILKADLNTYMQFKPKRRVMKWFGPLFQQRVFAFLLVLKRLELCKDVQLLRSNT
jgi:hypothetical protein